MQSILILRGGALGDFIVTLPAIAMLRKAWPGARIDLVGNAAAAAIVGGRQLIDDIHSEHESRWAALFRAGPLPWELETWLSRYDLIICYWPDPDGTLRTKLPVAPDQRVLFADSSPSCAPAAAHFASALAPLGLEIDSLTYSLDEPEPGARFVAIHPGSGSPLKNWAMENWQALCSHLRIERRIELLIVTGEAEPSDALLEFGTAARMLPLPELATRLRSCRLFLGHDSGISHLAAALGVPCILLFGPSDPATWAPPGPFVHVIHKGPSLADISVDEVFEAAVTRLPNSV